MAWPPDTHQDVQDAVDTLRTESANGGWRGKVGSAASFDKLVAPDGKLVLHSDSRNLFAGFDQHHGGYVPNIPPGYTTIRQFPGQTHSLMISGGERPYTSGQGQIDNGTTLFSRLTWQSSWKRAHLGVMFAVMGSDVYSWTSMSLNFDIQRWDNSDRAHFRAQLQDPFEGDAAFPIWKIANNTETFVTVPSSRPSMTGENENKGGWNFARLSIDLENVQVGSTHNSGQADTIGRYLELQCNDRVMNLTDITAGQGWQAPQASDGIGYFNGGFNPGVGMFRSTRNPTRIPMLLIGGIYVVVEE